MVLSILLVSPLLPATGNSSTVCRLQSHFLKCNYDVTLYCSHNLLQKSLKCNVQTLNKVINDNKIDCVFLLHAVKSGACVLCSCLSKCILSVKYGLIFGGTDLNEDIKDIKKLQIMQKCVSKAEFCVAFSSDMHSIAINLFNDTPIYQQAQALDYTLYENQFDLLPKDCIKMHSNLYVFVLPCSIRPVKDPLYLIDCICKSKKILKKDIRLLILGPVIDQVYGEIFFTKLCHVLDKQKILNQTEFMKNPFPIPTLSSADSNLTSLEDWMNDPNGSFIQYIPALSQNDFFKLLKQKSFFAVLNTSASEGMSSALLEAMVHGIPVIARNIPGNQSIICDKETGILFSTPDEFLEKAIALICNSDLLLTIVNKAKVFVLENHNPYVEKEFYATLVSKYFL